MLNNSSLSVRGPKVDTDKTRPSRVQFSNPALIRLSSGSHPKFVPNDPFSSHLSTQLLKVRSLYTNSLARTLRCLEPLHRKLVGRKRSKENGSRWRCTLSFIGEASYARLRDALGLAGSVGVVDSKGKNMLEILTCVDWRAVGERDFGDAG